MGLLAAVSGEAMGEGQCEAATARRDPPWIQPSWVPSRLDGLVPIRGSRWWVWRFRFQGEAVESLSSSLSQHQGAGWRSCHPKGVVIRVLVLKGLIVDQRIGTSEDS